MPRDATSELAYIPLTASPANITAAAAAIAGWAAIGYEVEQPQDPILVEVYFANLVIATLNATVTVTIQDQTVAGQFVTITTAILEGITAAGGNAYIVKARFQPQNFAALSQPALQGPRQLAILGQTSASTATVTASATQISYVQILDLARQ